MPRPFMTEHQQVGVAGRELDMIEPGVFLVERLELARLDIDREQGVRDLGFEDPGEIIGLVGILLQNRPLLFSRADAPQGRLVGIERRDAPVEVRGKDVDEACSPAGDLGSKNAVSALVKPSSPPRGNDLTENVPPMVGQLFDLQSFEIDGKELSPVGCGSIEHHLVAFARQLRNEWIVVKIEAGIAPFPGGQADQPVAGVLVDPFQRHGLLGAGLQHWRLARREGGLRPCHGENADQRQHRFAHYRSSCTASYTKLGLRKPVPPSPLATEIVMVFSPATKAYAGILTVNSMLFPRYVPRVTPRDSGCAPLVLGGVGPVHASGVPGLTMTTGRPPPKARVIPMRSVWGLTSPRPSVKRMVVGLFTALWNCAIGKSESGDSPTVYVNGPHGFIRTSDGCMSAIRSAFRNPSGVPSSSPMRKMNGSCGSTYWRSSVTVLVPTVTVVVRTASSFL